MSKRKPKQIALSTVRGEARLAFEGRRYESALPLYESVKTEEVCPPSLTAESPANLLLRGDCLSACALLKARNIAVDLVYIDPPFASGADYKGKLRLRNGGDTTAESDTVVSEEVAYGDIWGKENYLNWMFTRLRAIREVMSPTASIYVHLDWHIGHYVKVLMDEVFGEENFINEIIWYYKTGGMPEGLGFGRKHDTVYLYSKNKTKTTWNPMKEKSYLSHNYGFSSIDLQKDEVGTYSLVGVRDVWDIAALRGNQPEKVSYPTQKPEALLERIIKASSNPGMVVADFFCGSGTAAKVAHDLGRRWIACDLGGDAIRTTRNRLARAGASFGLEVISDGMRLLNDCAKIKEKLLGALPGFEEAIDLKLGDFWDGVIANQAIVKLFDPATLFAKTDVDRVLLEMAELQKTSPHRRAVVIYAHKEADLDDDYINRRLRQEITNGRLRDKSDLKALSVEEWLAQRAGETFPADSAIVSRARLPGGGWQVKIERFYSPYLADKFASEKISDAGLELIESVHFQTGSPRADGVWRGNSELEDAPAKGQVKGEYHIKASRFRIKICNIAGEELILSEIDCKTNGSPSPARAAKPARKAGGQSPRRKSKPAQKR